MQTTGTKKTIYPFFGIEGKEKAKYKPIKLQKASHDAPLPTQSLAIFIIYLGLNIIYIYM